MSAPESCTSYIGCDVALADRHSIQMYKLSAVPRDGPFWDAVPGRAPLPAATVQIRSGMLREPAAED